MVSVITSPPLETPTYASTHTEVAASTAALCQIRPQPTKQPRLLAASITLGTAVAIFVVLRCYSRYSISKQFWWDDWLLILAAVSFAMA
jgi:hypothetical protein